MKALVSQFHRIEKRLGHKAHYVETLTVLTILVVTALISGKGWVEWVGVFGVMFSFEYQLLSTYLREHIEARKEKNVRLSSDHIAREVQILYYLKELVWILYFLFLGAYSALVGTFIFILYGMWRKLYRHHYPVDHFEFDV